MKYFKLAGAICLAVSAAAVFGNPFSRQTVEPEKLVCRGAEIAASGVAAHLNLELARYEKIRELYRITDRELCDAPEPALRKMAMRAETPKPDQPGEWARFREMQRRDEHGVVRPDGLLRALERRHSILQVSPVKIQGRVVAPSTSSPTTASSLTITGAAGSLAAADWINIGPGNIGGRIRSIVFNPGNANQLWAGSVAGGMWRSNDAGASWAPVNDFMSNLSISSIVVSSTNPSVMYAGTGEGFFNGDAVRGAGVLKSTDGGVTWNPLSAASPAANSSWYYVNRLAMHPGNGDILLAATRNGGVFRTTDGGATWTNTLTAGAADVKFDPLNGNNAIMGPAYYNYAAGQYGGYIRYSRDGGATWTNSSLSVGGRVEIAYSKSSGIVYASADVSNGTIYKSVDGGATWTLMATPGHLSSQGWYDNAIWVDPTNANHIITGGLDLWRSTNGGSSFTKISDWTQAPPNANRSAHADHHVIVSPPNYDGVNVRKVYFGNDGGVFAVSDINAVTTTTGWTNLNNGLSITQFYGGAGHNGLNGRIIGGTQDNGSLKYTGTGTTWAPHFGGDGGYSAIDPTDGNYIYGEYVYLKIHRSTNGGTTSSSYIYTGIGDAGSSANFIAPFILDANNPNTMLAGGASLWRSTNVKATTPSWASIKASTGSNISAIETAKGSAAASDIIFVGHNDGSVYKTTSGTLASPAWTKLTGLPTGRAVLSIYVEPSRSDTVYVGFGGYSTANLWRSTDGGTTWQSIGGSLPASPLRAVTTHPQNASYVYAGTEVGIFTSQDGGSTWTTTNAGPANASVERLFWLDSTTIAAATHGRGMFKASISLTNPNYTLAVTKGGTGAGSVASSPLGIDCGSVCSASYVSGTSVTLTATAASGSTFAGWGGACSGTGTCTVSMSAAQNVTATFNSTATSYVLSIGKSGTGSGAVASSPAGIDCGATCSATFASGAVVDLTPTAASGSSFAGWGGACSGTGSCSVTMNAAANVTATFNALPGSYTLSVTKSGSGSGSVVSSPAGIDCGASCSASFATGVTVTLTATAASGSAFAGWGGACSGTGACSIAMGASQSVSAAFNSTSTVLTNQVPVTGLSGTTGSQKIYTFVVPTGAKNLQFNMAGGSGNADLYVRLGSAPTTSAYTCRSISGGNTDACYIASPSAGTYYVMLNGTAAYSGLSVIAAYTTGTTVVTPLTNGVARTSLSGSRNKAAYYSLFVPGAASAASMTTSGGSGDLDLYVRKGVLPTTAAYDCRPFLTGNNESCSFPSPAPGMYYIMLYGYQAYSGAALTGSFN